MRFRRRPLEVEAMQFHGDATSATEIQLWSDQAARMFINPQAPVGDGLGMVIDTLEGTMKAAPGDWIIRGQKGEYYPCKPDIFAINYEPVGSQQATCAWCKLPIGHDDMWYELEGGSVHSDCKTDYEAHR